MRFDNPEVDKEFRELFAEPLTVRQAWWLVKVIKHCRQRCRNNAALNNWLNRNFKHLNFKEVQKQREDGSTYPGLSIMGSPEDGPLVGEDND